jgi:flagellar motor switch protein FliN/FliY
MGMTPQAQALVDALVSEMTGAVFALTGQATTVSAAAGPAGEAWIVQTTAAGSFKGSTTLSVDAAGTMALARTVLGTDTDLTPTKLIGLVREIVTHAAGAIGRQQAFAGLTLTVDAIEQGTSPAKPGLACTLEYGDGGRLDVTATASLEGAAAAADAPADAAGPAMFASEDRGRADSAMPRTGNWGTVLDIDLPVRVRFGVAEMSIRALSALGPGSIVDMGRGPDDPVEILVCGRVIARAEVVVVDGSYGVRVTDLLSASERVRALEGQW